MIPVIKEFIVDKYRIMKEDEFLDVIVTAQTVPGVIAINTAMILGSRLAGFGALFAVLWSFVDPFIMILCNSKFLHRFCRPSCLQSGCDCNILLIFRFSFFEKVLEDT